MKQIAETLNREYKDEYIILRPKGNVIFANGETVITSLAQNPTTYKRYSKELEARVKILEKVKK